MSDAPRDLTHLTPEGHAHMVDVGDKETTLRRATARARVKMNAEAFAKLTSGDTPKGDVLAAAKLTPQLIPLCHAIQLTRVTVTIALEASHAVIDATAEARDRTGVEMEAMVAASTAALTLYDMMKAVDRSMTFDVRLLEKSGGRSGHFAREDEAR